MFRVSIVLAISVLGAEVADATPIVVDANGQLVGFYQSVVTVTPGSPGGGDTEGAVSQAGFRFSFDRDTGKLTIPQHFESLVFFATPNCTGQAYLSSSSGQGGGKLQLGVVFPGMLDPALPQIDAPLYYLPQVRPSEVSVQRLSTWSTVVMPAPALICFPASPSSPIPAYPVAPNDPATTGVPNVRFSAPLRVLSSWLFRDGFEQPLSAVPRLTGARRPWSETA